MEYSDFIPFSVLIEENLRFAETRHEQEACATLLNNILRLELLYRFKEANK